MAKEIQGLDAERIEAARQAKESGELVAQLRERESASTQKLAQQAQDLAHLQKQLTSEFENIANRILKANAVELSESSRKSVTAMLDPLRDRIQQSQEKVEQTYQAESREVFSLKEKIELILKRVTPSPVRRTTLRKR